MELHKSSWPGWETTRLIGRGSFGAVYEIERRLFEDDEPEKAALKVISIPQNDSDIEELYNDGYDEESVTSTFHTHLKSIVAEYSLMRKMNGSSNIVNCDDVRYVQHEDGIGWDIYIKMELLTPLAKALPAVVSEKQIIRIAMDMCNALELCGKHNIIHRDIKPQNIFVSENGDYKLGDFGIAKTVEKTMGGTKTGTYKYMAPEVYSNKPYNSTADIYSLGLVLYWLLNERRMPFMPLPPEKLKAGMDEESRNRRFSGEKIPAPKNGSKELKRIVLKACAFESKDRYQSAREMREDLMRLSGGHNPEMKQEYGSVLDSYEDTHDRTVGPNFRAEPYDDTNNHNQTVGPIFERDSVTNSEKTVGPDFSLKESQKKKDAKRNRSKPLAVIASLMAVCVLCAFFFGKDTEHDIGFAKDSKQQIDEEFQISEDQLSFNRVGDKVKLTANRDNVTWSTSDPMVASINSAGEVTIIGPGNAEIRSDWNGQTRICYVTVDAQQGTDSDYAVALNQLAVIEKYNEQFTTYSYVQLDDVYNEYVAAGGQIEPHSYPGTLIKEEPHANIRCYLADWYYVLKVEYNDSLGELIYEDVYNVITDKNQIDGSKPPYSTWSMNNHSFFYTIHSSSGTFHRYDNPDPDVIVKGLYGADYIDDGVTRCITVWADSTQKSIEDRTNNKTLLEVVPGSSHTVMLYSDGTVGAVGYNSDGCCDISNWSDIIAIDTQKWTTIGLKSDGTVVAAGWNKYDQCEVNGWSDIVAIASGGYHTVGLKADGTVVAVGLNDMGQCNVSDWKDIIAIDVGNMHTVGLKADGTVVAVGRNDYGTCNVSNWKDIIAISTGEGYHTVGLKADGTVVAVGLNDDGQCNVSSWTDIVAISAGNDYTVGVTSNGKVIAVGNNEDGKCEVSAWENVIYVAGGLSHTTGITADGKALAAGNNGQRQCDVSGLSLQ